MTVEITRWGWVNAILSERGPKLPETRLLLLVMSMFMDKTGGSCFPSVRTLMRRSGFRSNKTVIENIHRAIRDGWVEKIKGRVLRGRQWARNSYQAKIPEGFKQDDLQDTEILFANNEGGATTAPPGADSVEGGAVDGEGGATTAPPGAGGGAVDEVEAVQLLHTSLSFNVSKKINVPGTGSPKGKALKESLPLAPAKKRGSALRGRLTPAEIEEQKRRLLAMDSPNPPTTGGAETG